MRRLWIAFIIVVVGSFAVLGWSGIRIYQEKPPIPDRVVTTDGEIIVPSGEILAGQRVWRAVGGMQLGSVWGHGSYVAPDWTADYLHREAVFILNEWAQSEHESNYDSLGSEAQAGLRARLADMMKSNTYSSAEDIFVLPAVRKRAFEENVSLYQELFTRGDVKAAIPSGTLSDTAKIRQLASFYFWTSWAASTNRPGDNITYTSNWPHEPLVDNKPTSDAIIWTGMSIIMLLAGIGALVWYYAAHREETLAESLPEDDPLLTFKAAPSQMAVVKYFWVVAALFPLQMVMGVVSAHYGVEGDGFYGIRTDDFLPYSVARTWHTQLGIFWIATAWLAAGLFIGPAVSGHEPRHQRLGVNVLFGALVVIVF